LGLLRWRGECAERAQNVLVALFGLAVGWLVGIALCPLTKDEGALFAGYASAVSAFVTGYAAGKVDDLVKYLLYPQNFTRKRALHGLLFLVTFVVALIVVFEYRYWGAGPYMKSDKWASSTCQPQIDAKRDGLSDAQRYG
jgi:hypothetical protein